MNNVARDLNLTPGKTIKLDYTEHLGYFLRVTLKEEPVLRGKEEYNIIGTLKGGVRFVTSKFEKLNDDYQAAKEQYQKTQEYFVSEVLKIAG